MPLDPVNPGSLAPPVGFSHGMRGSGEWLLVAGQIGWDGEARLVSTDFVAQFAQALDNTLAVVREAGGGPGSIARMVLYVTSKDEYARRREEVGGAYRERMQRHYPAMTLIEVKGLLEQGALIEIEAVAMLPAR